MISWQYADFQDILRKSAAGFDQAGHRFPSSGQQLKPRKQYVAYVKRVTATQITILRRGFLPGDWLSVGAPTRDGQIRGPHKSS